jgi:hypothetical protein
MLSRAAKNERTAIADLKEAEKLIHRASSKLRADSTGTILSGELIAATLIIGNVYNTIDDRTTEV